MRLFLFIAFFSVQFSLFSQTNLPYKVGEYAAYKVSFGPIWVGYADLEITEIKTINQQAKFSYYW